MSDEPCSHRIIVESLSIIELMRRNLGCKPRVMPMYCKLCNMEVELHLLPKDIINMLKQLDGKRARNPENT